MKTGGPNWQRQNLQPSTLQPMEQAAKSANWSGGMQAGHFPINPMQSQPVTMGQPMGMQQQPMGMGMGMQPMGMGMQPMMQQPMMMQQPRPFVVSELASKACIN